MHYILLLYYIGIWVLKRKVFAPRTQQKKKLNPFIIGANTSKKRGYISYILTPDINVRTSPPGIRPRQMNTFFVLRRPIGRGKYFLGIFWGCPPLVLILPIGDIELTYLGVHV